MPRVALEDPGLGVVSDLERVPVEPQNADGRAATGARRRRAVVGSDTHEPNLAGRHFRQCGQDQRRHGCQHRQCIPYRAHDHDPELPPPQVLLVREVLVHRDERAVLALGRGEQRPIVEI